MAAAARVAGSSPVRTGLTGGDDKAALLIVFVAATLLMVAVVTLVGAVDRWWVLVPAMLIDAVLTSVVIALIIRLLADDGEPAGSRGAR